MSGIAKSQQDARRGVELKSSAVFAEPTQQDLGQSQEWQQNLITLGCFGGLIGCMLSYIMSANAYAPLATFLTAGLAAMTAETFTFPMDAIKARMQLSATEKGSKASEAPTSSSFSLASFAPELPTLYYGLGAALCRTLPYSGIRLMLYEQLRGLLDLVPHAAGAAAPPFLALVGAAIVSGAVAQCIASPVDLLKIRMQSDGRRVRNGEAPVYGGLGDAARRIVREEGVGKLWTGAMPNVLRACCINVGDQAAYDVAKRVGVALLGAGLAPVFFASCVTGITVAFLACPADTLRSKMMNNGPSAPQPLYSSLADCFRQTYRAGGIPAFYGAVWPMYLREAPYYVVFWLTLEGLKMLRP